MKKFENPCHKATSSLRVKGGKISLLTSNRYHWKVRGRSQT